MKNVKIKALELIASVEHMFASDISVSKPLYQVVLVGIAAMLILIIAIAI